MHLLGVLAHQSGHDDIALELIGKAIAQDTEVAVFHSNLGIVRKAAGQLVEAVASCRCALALRPDYGEAYANLANALQAQGLPADAVAACRRALIHKADLALGHYNLAIALQDLGLPADAASSCRKALVCRPDFAEAQYNLGVALHQQAAPAEAIIRYRRAIAIRPAYAQAHHNLGVALLLSGRLAEGWPEYEWRRRTGEHPSSRRDFPQPQWRGEALAGKTILLHAEQGMGDAIHFCRYVPMVAERGCRVVLEVHRPLMRLFAGLAGGAQIVARGDALPPFDVHCPLLSLPGAFATSLETIPAAIPYLAAEAERISRWRDRLPGPGFRVGIVWQGSPSYRSDRGRSAPLASFAPLARIPGVRLVSLQTRVGLEQLAWLPAGMEVAQLGPDFDEGADAFLDAAAVMTGLDLIISVDTAIGHLAGALGRPVWLALGTVPYWPWMLERDDTPWYPCTRLFRQNQPGDWDELFERMGRSLAALVAGRLGRLGHHP